MPLPRIRIRGLGKRYRVAHSNTQANTVRDVITHSVRSGVAAFGSLVRRNVTPSRAADWFWALRDVTIDVASGQVVGIVGANGAGKSTLLKVVSRITEPTTGRVEVRGRIGSLIEVGTGFHSELTGRENTYLNGAILGMRRAEIKRKFDEIVAYAGVERFIDTPIKHYSSGMQLRLGFAVAAHLNTEILIVDEVLAVGDADFQRKCLATMSRVAHEGRTVLFVSHNVAPVKALCTRAIWLKEGRIAGDGPPRDVLSSYLTSSTGIVAERLWPSESPHSEGATFQRLAVRPAGGVPGDSITTATPLSIELDYRDWDGVGARASVAVFTEQELLLFESTEPPAGSAGLEQHVVRRAICHVPANLLGQGVYRVEASILDGRDHSIRGPEQMHFAVAGSDEDETTISRRRPAIVRPRLAWDVQAPPPIADAFTEA